MRAALVTTPGRIEDITLGDIAEPTCPPDGLLVRVHAAGVNFPDVLLARGQYQEKPTPPFAPGLELAGVVEAVGAEVSGFRRGDAVMATTSQGGFAELAAVKASLAQRLPEGIPLDVAAAVPITYGTTLHAFTQRTTLATGETLLVLGAAGGVGLAAVELGRLLGARVVAAASTEEKRKAALAAGAHDAIDEAPAELAARIKSLTGGKGVDIVYDPVGGDLFDQAMRCLAPEGRVLVIGFAGGRIPELKTNRLLLKECSAIGVYWGAFARRDPEANRVNFVRLIDWLKAGAIRPPIWQRFTLAEVPQALAALAERRVIGKAVVVVRPS